MARIAGVDLPGRKHTVIALQYIYGIGPHHAKHICESAGIPQGKRAEDLDETDVKRIRECIDQNFKVEGDLRREVNMHIKRLMDLGLLSRASVIGAVCLFEASEPTLTRAPVRDQSAGQ